MGFRPLAGLGQISPGYFFKKGLESDMFPSPRGVGADLTRGVGSHGEGRRRYGFRPLAGLGQISLERYAGVYKVHT